MPKLFLHIGLPKTATSSIQKFLQGNAEFLHANGLHYVGTGLHPGLGCHHDLVWALGLHQGVGFTDPDIREREQAFLAGLERENREHADLDLVISSELLAFVDDFHQLGPLLAAFPGREVRFVLYLRRQDDYLESLYQQIVKDGLDRTFDNWLGWSRHRADYRGLVERLLAIATPDQLILRAFRQDFAAGGPVQDFLAAVGIAPQAIAGAVVETRVENPRMSRETIEIIRKANALGLELNYFLNRRLRKYSGTKAEFLTPSERQALLAGFRDDNRALAEMIALPKPVGRLLLDIDPPDQTGDAPGGIEAEVEILLRLIGDLRDETEPASERATADN